MRMILAGDWRFPMYEQAAAEGFRKNGVDVLAFPWAEYFNSGLGRLERAITFDGPSARRMNDELLKTTERVKPDILFFWGPRMVLPQTLLQLRDQTASKLVCYEHDDPWSPGYRHTWRGRRFWRYFIAGIPHYDLHLLKRRPLDGNEILGCGARRVVRVWLYFVPSIHRPVHLSEEDMARFGCDVTFVGHYEPDGRVEYLRALVKAGLHVRLFGGNWTHSAGADFADNFGGIRPVLGEEYAKALCAAKMCLCFLSRLNRDTHTNRCFEIPACGRLLLSERTEDLKRLFKEDEEAVFFSSKEELVEKTLWLSEHQADIERIALAGMRRVHQDSHSADDRMKYFLNIITELRA